jgi:serine/threonine protein phosphatase PrpC
MNIVTFYTQAIGSSHISSGKPCQDNGTHYHSDGVSIAVVCDGHGGDSYVRSDIGSKLASEIAREKILGFVKSPQTLKLLKGKAGSVTAVPNRDARIDGNGHKRDVSMLSESELELHRQNCAYVIESQKFPEIENAFRSLFKDIFDSWKLAIQHDQMTHAFNKKEREKLGSLRIEKAYGTTLMAAVRTQDYWFAFHIGDGKLFACDELMQWREPIPWDCNCFLNVTTSLCDSHPVNEFRYAFDGTGNFPIAFTLGSDGIDDTFIKSELIHKFYSQLLMVFDEHDMEESVKLLTNSLSNLSARGSHDDMSVAAIIDLDELPRALQYYKIISEVRSLTRERDQKKEEINLLSQKIAAIQQDLLSKIELRDKEARAMWDWRCNMVKQWENKKTQYEQKKYDAQLEEEQLSKCIDERNFKEKELSQWEEESRKRVSELRLEAESIKSQIIADMKNDSQLSTGVQLESSIASSAVGVLSENLTKSIESDDPRTIYIKASEARMTEEGIAKMDKDADAQAKEIMNNMN